MLNAKILLIDNNVSVVDSFTKSLQDVYRLVRGVKSLEDAAKMLMEKEFDVIVYHTAIDGNDGFNALEQFRSCDSHPSIIAYSESPSVKNVIDILKNGVFDFLIAPFNVNRLIKSINNGIENKKSFIEIINLNKKLMENQEILEFEKDDLKNKNTELQALTDITKAMTGSLELNDVLHEIIHGIYNVFSFDRIFVSLIDTKKGLEEVKIAMGLQDNIYEDTIKKLSWDINDNEKNPWMNKLVRAKKLVKVVNPLKNKRYMNCEIVKYHPATFVKVPLIAKGNIVGSLTFDNVKSGKPISSEEIETVKVFADHAGIAIEKARLYENLKSAHNQLMEIQKKIIKTERLMAISEMAVSVNHEINNPLCSISLAVEILTRELDKSTSPIKEKLKIIGNDIERIKNIISQLAKIQDTATIEYTPDIKMIDIKQSLACLKNKK
jgi:DNA-binding response OmpR family regulator